MNVIRALLACIAAVGVPAIPAIGQGPTTPPLTFDEKVKLLSEAQNAGVPRGGRWVWMYRPWNCPRSDEVIVWDSSVPDQGPRVDRIEVPCWLKQTISLLAEGVVDGTGQPYSGPLLVKVSPAAQILGPYPEGFVCCLDGAFRVDLVAQVLQFAEDASVHVGVHYRIPPAELMLADGPFPSHPDVSPDRPPRDVTVMGNGVWFRPVAFEGNTFSEVQNFAAGGVRELRVEARCVLPSGRPATRLPMEFAWRFIDAPELKEKEIVHLTETSLQGKAADSVQVPEIAKKGWVEIKCHTHGDEFSTLAVKQFDFTKPQE
jgi:hypothetical protein